MSLDGSFNSSSRDCYYTQTPVWVKYFLLVLSLKILILNCLKRLEKKEIVSKLDGKHGKR